MNFNEIFEKNVTYDDIKSDQKTKLYTLFRQYIFCYIFLGLRLGGFFWNETSIIVFAELAIFHSI